LHASIIQRVEQTRASRLKLPGFAFAARHTLRCWVWQMDHSRSIGRADGLCATCAHVETIRSDRSSIFYQCLLSARDPRFVKYPRLPVLVCPGYASAPGKRGEPELG
jgi:hypothetical protein